MTARLPLVLGPNGLPQQLQSGDTLAGAGSGTVTSVGTGTGLTGGPVTSAGTIALANTAVTPATYGDATHVAQITFDQQGRATSAANVAISSSGGGAWPAHTTDHGVTPGFTDNTAALQAFGTALALLAPASSTGKSVGGTGQTYSGTCTFNTSTNVVTITTTRNGPQGGFPHRLPNGSIISFSTSGTLPSPLIANTKYYLLYGSVTPTTFKLTVTPLLGGDGHRPASPLGTALAITGVPTASSGTHTYTVYAEDWVEVIYDPGFYYYANDQFITGYGLKKLRVSGYGAKLMTGNTIFGGFPADFNAPTDGLGTLYLATINTTNWDSGGLNNTVTINSGSSANFYVNSWVLIACMDTQGSGGAPRNWNTFEFAQIANISGNVITFYDPLKNNYDSTLPVYQPTGGWTGNVSGPALIVQLPDTFDQQVEVNGFSIICPNECAVSTARVVRFKQCEFLGNGTFTGPFPSFINEAHFEECTFDTATPEIDKLINYLIFRDCDFDAQGGLLFQSTGLNETVVDACRLHNISGTPKNLVIKDTLMGGVLQIGPTYGATERIRLINSQIPEITSLKMAGTPVYVDPTYTVFSNGTLKIASGASPPAGSFNAHWNTTGFGTQSDNPLPWAVPGAKAIIYMDIQPNGHVTPPGASVKPNIFLGTMLAFEVRYVYVDGSNHYCVDTNLAFLPTADIVVHGTIAGSVLTASSVTPSDAVLIQFMTVTGGAGTTLPGSGFTYCASDQGVPNTTGASSDPLATPTYALGSTGGSIPDNATPHDYTFSVPMRFLSHPCPRMTVEGCTGGKFVTDQVGSPADIPLFSYFNRTYGLGAFTAPFLNAAYVDLIGNNTSITINVSKAYTGAVGTVTMVIYLFCWKYSGTNIYPTYTKSTINLKTAGTRVILPSGSTGAVAGDTLVDTPYWLSGGHLISLPASLGGSTLDQMPEFNIVGRADQGIGTASLVTNNNANTITTLYADTVLGAIL